MQGTFVWVYSHPHFNSFLDDGQEKLIKIDHILLFIVALVWRHRTCACQVFRWTFLKIQRA